MKTPFALVLAGPTGVGKSAVALLLAQRLQGEIISVDSMQVYRGMDIGTAKPSRADRASVPHHLIDVTDLSSTFDAAAFMRLGRAALHEIQERSRVPILCGGTGLYFRALLEGLGEAPSPNQEIRQALEQVSLETLQDELRLSDPVLYQTIDRSNRRRVIRALEVIRLTGVPFSEQRARWSKPGTPDAPRLGDMDLACFGLARERTELQRRIDERVESMFARGLVGEVQHLLHGGLAENRTASQALGYRQVIDYLQGRLTLEATRTLVQIRTRQYAKRQMTWFRHQMRLEWICPRPKETDEEVADRLATAFLALRRGP